MSTRAHGSAQTAFCAFHSFLMDLGFFGNHPTETEQGTLLPWIQTRCNGVSKTACPSLTTSSSTRRSQSGISVDFTRSPGPGRAGSGPEAAPKRLQPLPGRPGQDVLLSSRHTRGAMGSAKPFFSLSSTEMDGDCQSELAPTHKLHFKENKWLPPLPPAC